MQGKLAEKILIAFEKRWSSLFSDQVVNLVAYGSGAFPQTKHRSIVASNTLDLIVEVKDSKIFHKQAKKMTPNDYSGLASIFSSKLLEFTDNHLFPMHSNHINIDGKNIKYSVVSQSVLRKDLHEWNYLSFAGRFQKPIFPIKPLNQGLDQDIIINRQMAIATALLLIEKKKLISHSQLFEKISQISYIGDIRFKFGIQDEMKVQNIVNHNYTKFLQTYNPILKKFTGNKMPLNINFQKHQISFSSTPQNLVFLLSFLPDDIIQYLSSLYPGETNLTDRILLGGVSQLPRYLKQIISTTNRNSSFWMASQNMISASPVQNLKYIGKKLKKKIDNNSE